MVKKVFQRNQHRDVLVFMYFPLTVNTFNFQNLRSVFRLNLILSTGISFVNSELPHVLGFSYKELRNEYRYSARMQLIKSDSKHIFNVTDF